MDIIALRYFFKRHIFPYFFKSDDYINYLKSRGILIGKGTIIYSPETVTIDISRPHMLKIGEYCKITGNVTVLAHDYSRSVLRRKYGVIVPEAKKTVIGNNVFVGMNSIILMGANIGDNSIVGAGSIVSGSFPNNVVIGGNPSKVIMTIEQFYQKRKASVIEDAYCFFKEFTIHNNKQPNIHQMDCFYSLFLERGADELKKHNLRTKLGGDSEDEVIEGFLNSSPIFDGYQEFKKYCIDRMEKEKDE